MFKKIIYYTAPIVSNLIFITMGIAFIISGFYITNYLFQILGIFLLFSVLIKIFNLILKQKRTKSLKHELIDLLLNIGIGLYMVINPILFINFSTLIFGLYALTQSLIQFINFDIYRQDNLKGKIKVLSTAIITLFFALLLLSNPTNNALYLYILIGIYLIFYGLNNLIDLLITSKGFKLPLPIILTFFTPKILLRKVSNDLLTSSFNSQKSTETPDLEVLVHLAPGGSAGLGHTEIAFEGKIYSYGCYNNHSRRLFGSIGDGVLAIADRDSYLRYCVHEKKRFILVYGIKLTEPEKLLMRETIDKFINTNTYSWYPDAALFDMGLTTQDNFKDMGSHIYKLANGKFLKFKSGKLKTFFVLRTNCVTVADTFLGTLGTKLLPLEGIITPGTYYNYLEQEYLKRKSNVISKKLYNKNTI